MERHERYDDLQINMVLVHMRATKSVAFCVLPTPGSTYLAMNHNVKPREVTAFVSYM